MSVQANNIYVGARYIPRIMGEYNNETAYEALDIVTSGGVGYISRQPVPAGTAVSNKEYWAMWGSGNAAIDALTQRVATNENDITALEAGLQQTNQNLQKTNQNLQKTNQNLENLVIPWEPASTLKGDGSTDNTAAFGQLDANTPVSLMPGNYLISGNVTIPCAVQFLPGAKLVYKAATPGTNYCTVTFSKGFVEYGTQIFDTYIVPRVGSQNATPEINPAWYGVAENQTATNNDLALTWILSSTMGAKRVNFAPGTYTFSNISQGTYFNAQEGAEILGNGAVFNGGITVPNITFNNVTFTGAITANRGTFKECAFNGGSSISSIYGHLKIVDCKFNWAANILVSTMGTNGFTLIEKCTINRNATNLSTPFSLSDRNTNIIRDCVFNDLMSEGSMPHFSIQMGTTSNNRVVGCYMPTGKIVCACAENNLCYMLTADNAFSNMVGGSYQKGLVTPKVIAGYKLVVNPDARGENQLETLETIRASRKYYVMGYEIIYSDGSTERRLNSNYGSVAGGIVQPISSQSTNVNGAPIISNDGGGGSESTYKITGNTATTGTCRIGFTIAVAPPNLESIYTEQNCYLESGPVG